MLCPSTSTALVILDAAQDGNSSLLNSSLFNRVLPKGEWLLLNPNQDGIAQITTALAHRPALHRSALQSLHIIPSYGLGGLKLGSTHLTLFNLDRYGWQFQQWGDALVSNANANANMLFYAPPMASDRVAGLLPLLTRLQLLTGATISTFGPCILPTADPTLNHLPAAKSFHQFAVGGPSQ